MNDIAREFVELIDKSGLKDAAVARLIFKSSQFIGQVRKGDANPAQSTLELLREKLKPAAGGGGAMVTSDAPSDQEINNLVESLRELPEAERRVAMRHFSGLADLIKSRLSSSPDEAASRELEASAERTQAEVHQSRPASGVGSTSGVSYGQKRRGRVRPGAKESQSTPGPK